MPVEPIQQTTEATEEQEAGDQQRPADATAVPPKNSGNDTRRPQEGMVRGLAFDEVSVDILIPWIVEITGKVVMPVRLQTLKGTKITLMNDEPLKKQEALDLLFTAFRLNDIGVIERDDVIILGPLSDIVSIRGDLPVLGPQDNVLGREDRGTIVIKIFPVHKARAEGIGDQILEKFPDYATLTVDTNSNQIVVMGDIGLCQQVQRLINELDANYANVATETFRLRYADANEIAANIFDLFDTSGTSSQSSSRSRQGGAPQRGANRERSPSRPGITPGPEVELRVTVNSQQNSVTVQAEPDIVNEIAKLIHDEWDRPRPEGTSKIYVLEYTDPIKVRDLLREVLGQGSGGLSGAAGRTSGRAGGAGQGRGDVTSQLSGIYQVEAYPDSNSLVVLCKTEESFDFLDSVITDLDRPSDVGLPVFIELKHAYAVDVADEINALLAEAGQSVDLLRPQEGLSGEGIGEAGEQGSTRETGGGESIQFPWQRGRARDDQSPGSALIGKIRVVPIIRQNALAVIAPPSYKSLIIELIRQFDQPGRQVMLSAIIAEVELTDDLALGLRVGENLTNRSGDNLVRGRVSMEAIGASFFGGIFSNANGSSSVENSFDVQVALQALAQKTNVRILQEPRVFTADNQEAIFFDGQDIPFITDSFIPAEGGTTQSFDYRQVGVFLNIRPRITAGNDVNLEINLELSSSTGQQLFGGEIIDRRQANSQLIVKDGQTIVISGILRETQTQTTRKIPLLGDIPLLGALFTSIDNRDVQTELLMFVTPTVVENPSQNDDNFNREERRRLLEFSEPLDQMGKDLHQGGGPARQRIRQLIGSDDLNQPPLDPLVEPADTPQ
jgi:general secretion pathway protein D